MATFPVTLKDAAGQEYIKGLMPGTSMRCDLMSPGIVCDLLQFGGNFTTHPAKTTHLRLVGKPIPADDWDLMEALADGTVHNPLSKYASEPHSFWWVRGASLEDGIEMAEFADKVLVGKPYDYPFFLHCTWHLLWGWVKHGFKKHSVDPFTIPDDDPHTAICLKCGFAGTTGMFKGRECPRCLSADIDWNAGIPVCTEVADACDFVPELVEKNIDWDGGGAPTPYAFTKAIETGRLVRVIP